MSYRELEEAEARAFMHDCVKVAVFALLVVGLIILSQVAGCDVGGAGTPGAPTCDEIRNEDAPALVGLGRGTYAYPTWDRNNNVCYLVVTRGDQMVVIPRLNPDGSVMVLGGS